jgi:catechol 2,3-dioxygenase-like lactoylglutathione lyase family enzyme
VRQFLRADRAEISHGGVSVPDLEASIRWYRDVLGFEVEHRFEIPKARATEHFHPR